jgi:dTDP-glucose pyrophosphorylase
MGCDTLFDPAHVRAVAEYDAATDIVLSVKWDAQIHHSTIMYNYGCTVEGIAEKPPFPTSTTQSLMLYRLPPKIMTYLLRVRKSPRGEYEIQDAINLMIADGATVALVECEDYFHLTKQEDIENYESRIL